MNEVVPGLFVGDYNDAALHDKDFVSINVAHEHRLTLPDSLYLPWWVPLGNGQVNISRVVLDAVAEIIALNLAMGKKVLVNCNKGQERAPLTVAWYLMKKTGKTFDEAYALVKEKRPETLDRKFWLTPFL